MNPRPPAAAGALSSAGAWPYPAPLGPGYASVRAVDPGVPAADRLCVGVADGTQEGAIKNEGCCDSEYHRAYTSVGDSLDLHTGDRVFEPYQGQFLYNFDLNIK